MGPELTQHEDPLPRQRVPRGRCSEGLGPVAVPDDPAPARLVEEAGPEAREASRVAAPVRQDGLPHLLVGRVAGGRWLQQPHGRARQEPGSLELARLGRHDSRAAHALEQEVGQRVAPRGGAREPDPVGG